MGYSLFLDDVRNPYDISTMGYMKLRTRVNYQTINWVIVRNFDQFKAVVDLRGIPELISYDHDLSEEHYNPAMYDSVDAYKEISSGFVEKTGLDCAKYIIASLGNIKHPPYLVHSMNPAGLSLIISEISTHNMLVSSVT